MFNIASQVTGHPCTIKLSSTNKRRFIEYKTTKDRESSWAQETHGREPRALLQGRAGKPWKKSLHMIVTMARKTAYSLKSTSWSLFSSRESISFFRPSSSTFS